MLIRLLIIAVALVTVLIGHYIKKSSAAVAALFDKEIPDDFFKRFSRYFFTLGIIGLPVAALDHSLISLCYIVILLILSAVFGFTLSKQV